MAKADKTITVDVKANDPTGILATDKRWYQSKKFAIWLVSFLGFGGLLGWAMQSGADRWIAIALVGSMATVSGVGLLGQAFVDGVVRFARAWRGIGSTWGSADQ